MDSVPRRRRSWLLIASLFVNVLLMALIGVSIYRLTHIDTRIGSGGMLSPRMIAAAAPSARPAIGGVIDAHTAKMHALRAASSDARRAAFRLLASPDYTPAKMTTALDAVAQADSALERESIAMMGDSLAKLSPDERAQVVARVRRKLNSWFLRQFRDRGP